MSFAPALALRKGDRKKLGDLARPGHTCPAFDYSK
jgi:hypothetical protein